MVYRANADSTTIKVNLTGNRLTVDDTVALKAGTGCVAVPGDPTKATCAAPESSIGGFKDFEVSAAGGSDTVFNFTNVTMNAYGGPGNDTLHGSLTAGDDLEGDVGDDKLVGNGGVDVMAGGTDKDSLFGGPARDALYGGSEDDRLEGGYGDSDLLDGGTGADILDGGPGLNDLVTYELRTAGILATIGSDANGVIGEDDEILANVESLRGGLGDDLLVGDDDDNRLEGHLGNDIVVGGRGADVLTVSDGTDTLFAAGIGFGGLGPHDGARDRLFAQGGPNVTCSFSTTDPDFVRGC
jgi:Ca2+-binding RTX toxin-like protein